MENFIVEFQRAFSAEFCQHLMAKFSQSNQTSPGRTGSGIDVEKKNSLDLFISNLPDWQQECQSINQIVLQALIQYVRAYPFMITGAISPSIIEPSTRLQPVLQL